MGVKASGATLEIQLVADVARLRRDMADMQAVVKQATNGATTSLAGVSRASAAMAAQMAADAQRAARAAMGTAGGLRTVAGASGLAAYQAQNLAFQINDVVTGLASGQAPMRVLAQQSGQFYQIMQQSGLGVRGFVRALLEMTGVLKVTRDAELAAQAASAATAASVVKQTAERAAAALVAKEAQVAIAKAELAAAESADLQVAAEVRLVKALRAVEVQAGKVTIAQQALAAAQGEAAAAAKASEATTVTSLGRTGLVLGVAAAAAALLAAAFSNVKQNAASDAELKQYAASLGLTHKEMKRLKDVTVSWGDVTKATFEVLLERAGLTSKGVADFFSSAFRWIGVIGRATIAGLLAGFAGLIELVLSLGKNMAHLATGQFDKLTNPLKDVKARLIKTYDDVQSGFDKISARATDLSKARIKQQADEIIADRTAKKAKKEKEDQVAKELAQLDQEIAAHWRLAAAYQASDVEAIKAEALNKAEAEAIRLKTDATKFYTKELELAIATRASDGAKAIADIHAQAAALTVVNDLVEQGVIPVERMGEALEEQTKKRQLMAALAVAEEQGWTEQASTLREQITKLAFAEGVLSEELARQAFLRQSAANGNQLAALQRELELVGATNRARDVGLAQLEAERFIRENKIKDPAQIAALTRGYIDAANAATDLAEAQNNYDASLSASLDTLNLLAEQSQRVADIMSDAFGSIGDGIGGVLTSLTEWQAKEQEIADWKRDETKKAGSDAAALARIEQQSQLKSKNAQLQAVGALLAAGKTMFKEHSAGYKAMEAAERAFAIIQAVNTIKNVAAGAAKMFATLGPFAFPAVAAMIGVMAALGFSGGSSSQAAPEIPQVGTGSVLGDPTAKSASIANALELMAKNSTKGLDYSADMVRALRGIESNIGNLAAAVARSLQLVGGFFDTTGKLGTNSSGGLFGIGGLFSTTTTKSLYDQGIMFNAASVAQIMEAGISGATYQVIETIKKKSGFLGIGGSTKTSYSTSYGAVDGAITSQINAIIGNLYDSVVAAAKVLGLDVAGALKTFQVEIGQISFKDLTGDQITDQLNAVFSKIGDEMAGFAVAGLANFQKAGEGLFETLMRLAKDYLTIDAALKSIGMDFGAVGTSSIAARESLIDLAGGLDAFVDQVNFFYDHFLSDAQKIAFAQSQVDAAFQALGVSVPASIADFAQLVTGLDLSTDAGQQMFEALMAIAPAFYDAATAADQLAKKQQELTVQLLQAQGNAAAATALQRQIALAALDPALVDLQKQVWAAQDAAAAAAEAAKAQAEAEAQKAAALATAKDNLSQAYQRESAALQQTIDKFRGFAATLRDFRASLFTGPGSTTLSVSGAMVDLIKQAGLAAAGNEAALGGGLQAAGQAYLDIATKNARSLQDVERARALVARSLDQAIGGAEGQATIAEQQLDKMKDQVGKLIDIDDHVLSVTDAIKALTALMFPTSVTPPVAPPQSAVGGTPVPSTPGSGLPGFPEDGIPGGGGRDSSIPQKILERLDGILAQSTRSAKILDAADRGGALALVTDSDSPLDINSDGIDLA